ncbi:putative acyltransferase [Alternaria alternata]|nr:putative acyltransferase [Alternaria alternata]
MALPTGTTPVKPAIAPTNLRFIDLSAIRNWIRRSDSFLTTRINMRGSTNCHPLACSFAQHDSIVPYLVRMRGAHENDRSLLWHLPTTPGMHFSEEELYQDRERPQEGVVDIFVHDSELLALRISLLGRHGGCLDHEYATSGYERGGMRHRKSEVGVASYGCVRSYVGSGGDSDSERGATRFGCAHCESQSPTMKLRWELQGSRWLACRCRLRHVVTHLHVLALSLQMSRVEEHQATVTSDPARTRE